MEYAPVLLTSGKSTQYFNSKGSIAEKKHPVAAPAIRKDNQRTVTILCATDIEPTRSQVSIFNYCLGYKYRLLEHEFWLRRETPYAQASCHFCRLRAFRLSSFVNRHKAKYHLLN